MFTLYMNTVSAIVRKCNGFRTELKLQIETNVFRNENFP